MRRDLSSAFLAVALMAVLGLLLLGPVEAARHEEHRGRGHEAPHGGVLNVIGKELAHVEILIEGDTLEAWFLSGGHDTGLSVRIKAAEIPLKVTFPGKGEMKLILRAAPLKLAGEKIGNCSHFTAKADWLRGAREFEARGGVVIKGIREGLIIRYPGGYDPIHGTKDH